MSKTKMSADLTRLSPGHIEEFGREDVRLCLPGATEMLKALS